jgi:hypothetical protein
MSKADHYLKPWVLTLTCCGRDDGTARFATSEEADAFREGYTSGPGVDPHGYSGDGYSGHRRSAVKSYVPLGEVER